MYASSRYTACYCDAGSGCLWRWRDGAESIAYRNPNFRANFRPYSDIAYTFPDTDTHRYADANTASSSYPPHQPLHPLH